MELAHCGREARVPFGLDSSDLFPVRQFSLKQVSFLGFKQLFAAFTRVVNFPIDSVTITA